MKGSWGAEFYDGIAPRPDERVVIKHRYSAFINTDLNTVLKAKGIESVLVTGVATNVCVETTARDAYMFDYYVTLVEDCAAAYDARMHQTTLENIRQHFGLVAGPRFRDNPSNSPCSRCLRQAVRLEEYSPSRLRSAPSSPRPLKAFASRKTLSLYSAVYRRRAGFAVTSTSKPDDSTPSIAPIFNSLLAPYSTLNSRRVSVSSILAERDSPREMDSRIFAISKQRLSYGYRITELEGAVQRYRVLGEIIELAREKNALAENVSAN